MRQPDELLNSGLAVIDRAFTEAAATRMVPLFSGGHDSLSACMVASHHGRIVLARTGMLCTRCDMQAAASGLLFED